MSAVALIGIDLQEDNLGDSPALALEGLGAARVAARRLVEAANSGGFPLLLAADLHEDDDPVFESFPHHCVKGSHGGAIWSGLEVGETQRVTMHATAAPQLDGKALVVESRDHRRGLFDNAVADALIDALDAETHILFGGPVETGLRAAAMGLLVRGKRVVVVSDGISFLDGERASSHLASMAAEGCGFLSLEGALKHIASR